VLGIAAAGEDLAVVVANSLEDNSTTLIIDSNLRRRKIHSPLQHTLVMTSAMAAAGGKLYLLGGEPHAQADFHPGLPFEVYDPHVR
jgi:hypothetical protein